MRSHAVLGSDDGHQANDATVHHEPAVQSMGIDRGRGNLLGIQPCLVLADYAREETFFSRLDDLFTAAGQAGFLTARTVVVLPEYLGTWLALCEEASALFRADHLRQSMSGLAFRHLPSFLRCWLASTETNRAVAALLRLQAEQTAARYQRIFSRLARRYGVSLVAGSAVLPAPEVIDGRLSAGTGPLSNVSVVFTPDGQACAPAVRKVYPTEEEQGFIRRGRLDDLPVFDLPVGRLGVLICADAWFPDCYRQLRESGVELIAVPSYGINESFTQPWPGYSGYPAPEDVDPRDFGRITRAEAWRKYALEGRLALSGARAGLNVFLHGELWGAAGSGNAVGILDSEACHGPAAPGALLLNLWL